MSLAHSKNDNCSNRYLPFPLKDITDVLSLFKPMEPAVLEQCYKSYNGTIHTMTTLLGVATEKRDRTPERTDLHVSCKFNSCKLQYSCVWLLFLFLKEQPQICQYKDVQSWATDSLTVKPGLSDTTDLIISFIAILLTFKQLELGKLLFSVISQLITHRAVPFRIKC